MDGDGFRGSHNKQLYKKRYKNSRNNNRKIVDYGITDSMNMGAAMAPAACDSIYTNFMDFDVTPDYYDAIYTGDLGKVGRTILLDLMQEKVLIYLPFIMTAVLKFLMTDIRIPIPGEAGAGAVPQRYVHIY